MYPKTMILVVLLCAASVSGYDSPVVLDFEVLRVEDANTHDHFEPYSEDGFTITAFQPPDQGGPSGLRTAGTQHQNFICSTAPWNRDGNGGQVLTHDDGVPFEMISIDLAPLAESDFGPFDQTFFGVQADGSEIETTFVVEGNREFDTYVFSEFTNLVSVTWSHVATGAPRASPAVQFDNVVLDPPKPSCAADLNGDGIVDAADLAQLLAAWGVCPQ